MWIEDGREVRFFLEHDTGAGPVRDLMERIERHRQLRYGGGPDYPVLIWLPTRAREAELHADLKRGRFGLTLAGLTVATAARDTGAGPACAAWWVTTANDESRSATAGTEQDRCRLKDLRSDGPQAQEGQGLPLFEDPDRSNLREPGTVSNPVLLGRTLLGPLTPRQDPMYLPSGIS